MEGLLEKTTATSRGFQYRYYINPASQVNEDSPALFFMHGFRDSALCWQYLLPHLKHLPYRMLFFDMLGYGGTSRPHDPQSYAYHLMVQDLLDVADAEGIQKIVTVGHDHGAGPAQRLYNHRPERVAAVILLSVPYNPPNKKTPFHLAALNAMTTQMFGCPIAEYWNFLTAPDAAGLMNANLDRVWEIPHADSFDEMKSIYCVPNAMRQYLADRSIPSVNIKAYARNRALYEGWKAEIEKSGLESGLCWYTAYLQQVQFESDQLVPDDNLKVRVPMLFIGATGDAVCRPGFSLTPAAGLVADLTEHTLEGVGHWPMYEKPKEVAEWISEFLTKKIQV